MLTSPCSGGLHERLLGVFWSGGVCHFLYELAEVLNKREERQHTMGVVD